MSDGAPTHDTAAAQSNGSILSAAPGVARILASAWWQTTGWTVETTLRVYGRLARAALSGESPAEVFDEFGAEVRSYLRELLGIIDPDDRLRNAATAAAESAGMRSSDSGSRNGTDSALRERGAELLRRSADVTYQEDAHPAYSRILGDLAPDEGRILRLLVLEGPQPAVDVRSRQTLSPSSQLVAPGLSMIGAAAGCRYLDRVPAYLNNLYRLGLIWFSREAMEDAHIYQMLEAQPDVLAALRQRGRGRTVRRSIHLTPFGHDFCETCLPIDITGELEVVEDSDTPTDNDVPVVTPKAPDAGERVP
jgi:hypothetical protein